MQSRVASISRGVGAVAVLIFVGVPLAIQLGITTSATSFRFFLLGGAGLGLLALVLGAVGLLRTRAGSGREGRARALTGVLLGGGILVITLVMNGAALSLPPINDITTSPGDPPEFALVKRLGPNPDRDMGYPGEEFAVKQREGYPDLAPIEVASAPAQTLDRVEALVSEFGWELVGRDDAAGRVEATDTSAIFRFVDDIVVRVRPAASGGGSIVDVRSKSREGRGDLGANAARIRRLRDALSG